MGGGGGEIMSVEAVTASALDTDLTRRITHEDLLNLITPDEEVIHPTLLSPPTGLDSTALRSEVWALLREMEVKRRAKESKKMGILRCSPKRPLTACAPPSRQALESSQNDVFVGVGGSGPVFGGSAFHVVGNRRFRVAVEWNLPRYFGTKESHNAADSSRDGAYEEGPSSEAGRELTVSDLLISMRRCTPPARFVAFNEEIREWGELSPLEAIEYVHRTFRNAGRCLGYLSRRCRGGDARAWEDGRETAPASFSGKQRQGRRMTDTFDPQEAAGAVPTRVHDKLNGAAADGAASAREVLGAGARSVAADAIIRTSTIAGSAPEYGPACEAKPQRASGCCAGRPSADVGAASVFAQPTSPFPGTNDVLVLDGCVPPMSVGNRRFRVVVELFYLRSLKVDSDKTITAASSSSGATAMATVQAAMDCVMRCAPRGRFFGRRDRHVAEGRGVGGEGVATPTRGDEGMGGAWEELNGRESEEAATWAFEECARCYSVSQNLWRERTFHSAQFTTNDIAEDRKENASIATYRALGSQEGQRGEGCASRDRIVAPSQAKRVSDETEKNWRPSSSLTETRNSVISAASCAHLNLLSSDLADEAMGERLPLSVVEAMTVESGEMVEPRESQADVERISRVEGSATETSPEDVDGSAQLQTSLGDASATLLPHASSGLKNDGMDVAVGRMQREARTRLLRGKISEAERRIVGLAAAAAITSAAAAAAAAQGPIEDEAQISSSHRRRQKIEGQESMEELNARARVMLLRRREDMLRLSARLRGEQEWGEGQEDGEQESQDFRKRRRRNSLPPSPPQLDRELQRMDSDEARWPAIDRSAPPPARCVSVASLVAPETYSSSAERQTSRELIRLTALGDEATSSTKGKVGGEVKNGDCMRRDGAGTDRHIVPEAEASKIRLRRPRRARSIRRVSQCSPPARRSFHRARSPQ